MWGFLVIEEAFVFNVDVSVFCVARKKAHRWWLLSFRCICSLWDEETPTETAVTDGDSQDS